MSTRPHIVVLDGHTLNPGDLTWQKLRSLGQVTVYARSSPEEGRERAKTADILLVNKFVVDQALVAAAPRLRCIAVTATGYNNVDLSATKGRNIAVCNVRGYSTTGVAQHVFALLLALLNRAADHNRSVQAGDWSRSPDFGYTLAPIHELAGKTMGIYGFGQIGQAVGAIAHAFGMEVLATHTHPERDHREWVTFVPLEELFQRSWVVTLHAPLSDKNRKVVNRDLLAHLSPTAYLINTGRGDLIKETDLREALLSNQLAGAALDVLSQEPPPEDHPLLGLENCLLTPHIAWASVESRQRLMEETVDNVAAFLQGKLNTVYS